MLENHVANADSGLSGAGPKPTRSEGKLLIVDSDFSLRRALHNTLFGLGFDVSDISSAEEALSLCRVVRYEGVLLGANLPGRGCVEVCRQLRQMAPGIVIVFLGSGEDEESRIEALESGADDYVIRPVPVRELAARIRAALRRSRAVTPSATGIITIGEVEMHPARRIVTKGGVLIRLTPKEFKLLHHLMSNAGIPVTHSRLLHAIWGFEHSNQVEYLRTFMRQLRKKLEDDPANPRYLLTESHIGYRFVDPAEAPARRHLNRTGAVTS